MLIRIGFTGFALLYCLPGLTYAQQFFGESPHCTECAAAADSAVLIDPSPAYADVNSSFDSTLIYSTAQLPTYSTGTSNYIATPQAMVPTILGRPAYSIQYRQQASVHQVPVTTFQNVTVDRGSYQTVWVPRPVTQSMAQTTMRNQVTYQTVAVPVANSTQLIYAPVAQTVAIASPTIQSMYASQAPAVVFAPSTYASSAYSTAMAPQVTVPMIAADPQTYSRIASDHSGPALVPMADPSYTDGQTSVGSQLPLPESAQTQHSTAALPELPAHEPAAPDVTREYERPVRNPRARGMFEPVRSGTMWRGRYIGR